MSKDLFVGKKFSLTKFSGGKRGMLYQITQFNNDTQRHEYIILSKKDINFLHRKVNK